MPWPPRTPYLTPYDFFLWEFVKDLVYVPALPKDVDELKTQITEAVATYRQHNAGTSLVKIGLSA